MMLCVIFKVDDRKERKLIIIMALSTPSPLISPGALDGHLNFFFHKVANASL